MSDPQTDPMALLRNHLVAGLFGAMVGLRWAPGLSWLERVCNVGAGFACAAYLTPAAAEWFAITSVQAQAAMAFSLGMFGMSIAGAIVEAVRTADLGGVIAGWLGRRP